MFNKLIVSTTNRRKQRTARFFCGTAVFYLLSVAAAFAVSIIFENPKLADTSERLTLMAPPPMQQVSAPRPVVDHAYSGVATHNDPTHVNNLEDVINTVPGPTRPDVPPGPPGIGPVGPIGPSSGGGEWVPDSNYDGPGGETHGNSTAPPKPPDPPKPVAQVRPEDNRPIRLISNVLQGKAIVRRTPEYPALAKQIHLEGSVSVEVIVSSDGRVESARAVSGHALFKAASVTAATGWRFQPTLLNGMPVQVTGVIVFNFKLNE
ncbi:MAG TPA: energy transducer TonB [Blastocatellia bacterium]|nr:energy transducer TonB [Blastocatellia bacterium]